MRLALSIERLQGRLPMAVGNAHAMWHVRDGIWLRARDLDTENEGWGEATPLPGYSGESLERTQRALESAVADPARAFEPRALERLRDEAPSAAFALEAARLELEARAAGRSVTAHLAARDGLGAADRVRVSGLVLAQTPAEADARTRELVATGVVDVKVKVGRAERFEAELAFLRAVKAALPPGGTLRVDVNQAFEPEDLAERLERLAGAGVDLVEEPAELDAVERLSGSPVPLALDESLRRPDAAPRVEALAARGLVRCLVLKPAVLGGVARTLEWARRARALGVGVSLSHLFDGPIAHRMYAALALALGDPGPHGLAPHPGLTALAGPAPWPARGGHLEASAGLGLEPPEGR